MTNAAETAAAIAALNESEMGGRTIYVSESLPKEKVVDNKKKYKRREFISSLLFVFFLVVYLSN